MVTKEENIKISLQFILDYNRAEILIKNYINLENIKVNFNINKYENNNQQIFLYKNKIIYNWYIDWRHLYYIQFTNDLVNIKQWL